MPDAALPLFEFEGQPLRVHLDDAGEPWFVAKDAAIALGYQWKGISTIGHVPDAWRGVYSVQTPSAPQNMLTLSEPGLYFFVARSDKPRAVPCPSRNGWPGKCCPACGVWAGTKCPDAPAASPWA